MTPQAIRDGFDKLRTDEADAGPGRRRALPLRGRLAGRHQRHARDDRVQLARRRLLPDHRRPGADADAVDRGRARGEDPQARPRDYWEVKATFDARPGFYEGKWFDPKFKKDDDADRRADRVWDKAAAETIAAAVRGKPARSPRNPSPPRNGQPAAVRPDQPAARGQRPLRLLGQDHAVAGAGAVREAQGADLPADRLARAARGLPAGGQGHAQDARHRDLPGPLRELARTPRSRSRKATSSRTSASSTTPRSVGSLRHHPHAAGAQEPVRHRGQAVRPGRQALHRGVLPERRIPGHDAPDGRVGHHFQTNGKVLVNPGWLAVYGKEAQDDDANLVPVQKDEKVRPSRSRPSATEDAPAGALQRSHAAVGDGRRGQADRRRRTARGDGREGPGHAGHARGRSSKG
jgi:DNA topoisomerase-3